MPLSVKLWPAIGHEDPVVAARVQRQLQHPEGGVVAHLAVGGGWSRPAGQVAAAGADHELADPARRVGLAVGVLRREALVVVVVAGQYQVGVGVIERLVEGSWSCVARPPEL